MKCSLFKKDREISEFEKWVIERLHCTFKKTADGSEVPVYDNRAYANWVLAQGNTDGIPSWAVDRGMYWDRKKGRYVTTHRISKDLTQDA